MRERRGAARRNGDAMVSRRRRFGERTTYQLAYRFNGPSAGRNAMRQSQSRPATAAVHGPCANEVPRAGETKNWSCTCTSKYPSGPAASAISILPALSGTSDACPSLMGRMCLMLPLTCRKQRCGGGECT